MASPHLDHILSWKNLLEYFEVYKDGIELPIGKCGRIHLINKKTQIQVDHRKYLADQAVCNDPTCEVTGSKIFKKSLKKEISLVKGKGSKHGNTEQLPYFHKCFSQALLSFAETERKKVGQRNVKTDFATFQQEVIEKLKSTKLWFGEGEGAWCPSGRCQLFTALIEVGDASTLLSFSDDVIRSVLGCSHGQAIGCNIRFLMWHVLGVYLLTNLIVAAGLQNDPEAWGLMKPDAYFRTSLMWDCDGQTFLRGGRGYLAEGVYMKDWEAMKELGKDCFRFLYFVEMLKREVGDSSWMEFEDFKSEVDSMIW